ncbi:hypothetical protein [Dyadobacter psychrotolerans]|uniref:Uncharacterized protein n=1 Tax=Dyadobacter psychrotolerans TaxID=2541721 RepID=A0A4R5DCP0_9BACT|nr:hypothetical protein [Dyadobacter psychrotolerans]TDE08305.1 hypothetical protein E0F88_32920 [Dyadobacter psychrotolerans]
MKSTVTILGFLTAFVIVWHIKIACCTETKIVGLFKVQPDQPGYTWNIPDSNLIFTVVPPPEPIMTAAHFFWEDNNVVWRENMPHPNYQVISASEVNRWIPLPGYVWENETDGDFSTHWQAGTAHPYAKVVAAEREGDWKPMPGYKFTNEADENLSVIWEPGLQHTSYKAIAAEEAGSWVPMPGYQFVMNGNVWTDLVWTPGLRYDSFKIISDTQPDNFLPYPGYRFVNPGSSLDVIWDPGVIDSDDSTRIAGNLEGTWDNRVIESSFPHEPTSAQHYANAGVGVVVANVAEWIFGKNSFSDYVEEESAKELIRGVVKDVIK